jgi:DNA-binding CsgD family transcriptional regulator
MELGVCPKCQSRDQRFYEFDKAAKGRRLVCFQCYYVTHWVNTKDGRSTSFLSGRKRGPSMKLTMTPTPLELRCLSLAATGLSNQEIARELGYSYSYVKNMLYGVYKKYGAMVAPRRSFGQCDSEISV